MIGKTLGHYEVTSQLGKGGMGEVYQATDTKLGRQVAIKTLPEEFAQDEERLVRFEREAKLLASLNHPNIAAIYGLEEDNGKRFLVLELVEGDTLAERLKHGAIPVEESLKLALQIAEALEAAHEKGVIHRDLKPLNIKVTPDGKIKVLDFGLAKAFAGDGSDANVSQSPTLSMAATQQGVILGTAAYMSPEQARGQEVDKRADIWAFGVVLFEMLTGRGTFDGGTVSDVLAGVLRADPDWNGLPPNLHPRIKFLLSRQRRVKGSSVPSSSLVERTSCIRCGPGLLRTRPRSLWRIWRPTSAKRSGRVDCGHRRNDAWYLPTGHLVYVFENDLFALQFELGTLSVRRWASLRRIWCAQRPCTGALCDFGRRHAGGPRTWRWGYAERTLPRVCGS